MAKIILFIVPLFILNLSITLAQKSGYENLPWGSTVEQVRKKYPNIERTSDSDADFKEATVYNENYSSGSIDSREFVLWKNKLVKVLVTYNIDNITADGLMGNFKNKFGEPYDAAYNEEEINGIVVKKYDFYWNHNGTRVILRAVSMGLVEAVLTLYISLKYSDDYNSEKSKNIEF